jgi:hypothetical protein
MAITRGVRPVIGMRALATRVTAPWTAQSPRRSARLLHRFAETELGSAYTMRWAAARTQDEGRRALYLRHSSDAEDLFATLGERRFLAFVAHAEGRGRAQFEVHRGAFSRRDPVTAALFSTIIEEEREHERYALALLAEAFPGSHARSLFEVVVWESIREARRAADYVSRPIFRAIMSIAYLSLLPLALLLGGLRLKPRSVLSGTRDALKR